MAEIICYECKAWYNSQRELRDHMQTAHRKFGPGHQTSGPDGMPPDSFAMQSSEAHDTSSTQEGSRPGGSSGSQDKMEEPNVYK
jgi:hypothetical protein